MSFSKGFPVPVQYDDICNETQTSDVLWVYGVSSPRLSLPNTCPVQFGQGLWCLCRTCRALPGSRGETAS